MHFPPSFYTALLSKAAGVSGFSEVESALGEAGNTGDTTPRDTIARKEVSRMPQEKNDEQDTRALALCLQWYA